MDYTPNYNLKKPGQADFYNIEDFNENADIIDQKLKEIEDSVENIEVPVNSVNGKTGDVELDAADVGAASKEDFESHKNDNTRHISPNMPATAITFGGKFQIAYNSATNSLDITVVG